MTELRTLTIEEYEAYRDAMFMQLKRETQSGKGLL